jgi:hypothetical protein
MASRKSKIKFDAIAAMPAPATSGMCKTKCAKKASTTDGWCASCYAKFQKGYFTVGGDISPAVLKKQKDIAERKARREARRSAKRLESVKETIKTKITSNHLRVLSVSSPEADKPKYCEKLSFWTSDTVCYSRLFIVNNKRCSKCKIHDPSLETLLQFMENYDAQGTEIAAAQNFNTADDTAATRPSTTAS